jgi:hypothetical protein
LRDALLDRNELVGREIQTVLEAAGGASDLDPQVIDLTDTALSGQLSAEVPTTA